jgi:hypothetical protein
VPLTCAKRSLAICVARLRALSLFARRASLTAARSGEASDSTDASLSRE